MSQSNYIAAAIAVAFLVYITAKGSLSKYLALLTGSQGFGADTAAAGTKTVEQSVAPKAAPPTTTGSTDASPADNDNSSTAKGGPLDLLGSVMKGVIGGQADGIIGGVAGGLGLGKIIGGLL